MSYVEVVPHPNGGFAFTPSGRSATQSDLQFANPLDAYDFGLMSESPSEGIAMSAEANDWIEKHK